MVCPEGAWELAPEGGPGLGGLLGSCVLRQGGWDLGPEGGSRRVLIEGILRVSSGVGS